MPRKMRPLSRRWLSIQVTHHRSFTTSPPTQDSNSSLPPIDPHSALRQIDDITLATTKRKVDLVGQSCHELSTLASQILPAARTIQLNPAIPAYKVNAWTTRSTTLPPSLQTLAESIERLRLNITDLETTPYPSDSGEGESEKFKAEIGSRPAADKMTEMKNLGFEEGAVMHRLNTALESLEASSRAFVKAQAMATGSAPRMSASLKAALEEKAKRKMSLAEAVKSGREKGKEEGQQQQQQQQQRQIWGAKATESAEVGATTATEIPFTIRKTRSGPLLKKGELAAATEKAGSDEENGDDVKGGAAEEGGEIGEVASKPRRRTRTVARDRHSAKRSAHVRRAKANEDPADAGGETAKPKDLFALQAMLERGINS